MELVSHYINSITTVCCHVKDWPQIMVTTHVQVVCVHSTYALNSDYQWHHKVCTGHLPITVVLYPHGGQLGRATEPELPGWEYQNNSIATSNVCLYTVVVCRRTSKDKYAASYPNSPIQSLISKLSHTKSAGSRGSCYPLHYPNHPLMSPCTGSATKRLCRNWWFQVANHESINQGMSLQ